MISLGYPVQTILIAFIISLKHSIETLSLNLRYQVMLDRFFPFRCFIKILSSEILNIVSLPLAAEKSPIEKPLRVLYVSV